MSLLLDPNFHKRVVLYCKSMEEIDYFRRARPDAILTLDKRSQVALASPNFYRAPTPVWEVTGKLFKRCIVATSTKREPMSSKRSIEPLELDEETAHLAAITLTLPPTFHPFLDLPKDLVHCIADHLPHPDLHSLSATCLAIRSALLPTHEHLLAAEQTPWARSNRLFTCCDCLRLRRSCHFDDGQKTGHKRRGGRKAARRFCIDCGVNAPRGTRYHHRHEYGIWGKLYTFCRRCNRLAQKHRYRDEVGGKVTCGHECCWDCCDAWHREAESEAREKERRLLEVERELVVRGAEWAREVIPWLEERYPW